jgi:hypothetical protein
MDSTGRALNWTNLEQLHIAPFISLIELKSFNAVSQKYKLRNINKASFQGRTVVSKCRVEGELSAMTYACYKCYVLDLTSTNKYMSIQERL